MHIATPTRLLYPLLHPQDNKPACMYKIFLLLLVGPFDLSSSPSEHIPLHISMSLTCICLTGEVHQTPTGFPCVNKFIEHPVALLSTIHHQINCKVKEKFSHFHHYCWTWIAISYRHSYLPAFVRAIFTADYVNQYLVSPSKLSSVYSYFNIVYSFWKGKSLYEPLFIFTIWNQLHTSPKWEKSHLVEKLCPLLRELARVFTTLSYVHT